MAKYNWTNLAAPTSLSADVLSGDASLTVADGAGYPASDFKIWVNSEVVLVGTRTGNSFTALTRGVDGTTAAGHTSGDAVRHAVTAEDLLTRLLGVPATAPGLSEDEMVLVYDDNTTAFKWENAATFGGAFLPLSGGALTGDVSVASGSSLTLLSTNAIDGVKFANGQMIADSGGAGLNYSISNALGNHVFSVNSNTRLDISDQDVLFYKADGSTSSMFWDETANQWQMMANLDVGGYVLDAPGDPTLGTHVGDRDYNDARYALSSGGPYLPLSGGTMAATIGDIDMNASDVTGAFRVSSTWLEGYTSPRNSFGAVRFQNATINNMLWAADRRATVTIGGTGFNSGGATQLFDGDWDSRASIAISGVTTITIDMESEWGVNGISYVPGAILMTIYYTNEPASVTLRLKDKDDVWYSLGSYDEDISLTGTNYIYRWNVTSGDLNNYMTHMEFTVTAQGAEEAWLTQIEYYPNRPTTPIVESGFLKYRAQDLWHTLTLNKGDANVLSLRGDNTTIYQDWYQDGTNLSARIGHLTTASNAFHLSSYDGDVRIEAINSGAGGQNVYIRADDASGVLKTRVFISGTGNTGIYDNNYGLRLSVTNTGVAVYGSLVGVDDPTLGTHVGDRDYNDARYALASGGPYLPLAGGTMTGSLALNGNNLVGVIDIFSNYSDIILNARQLGTSADILFKADDSTGVKLRQAIRGGGDLEFYKSDGTTIALYWDESVGQWTFTTPVNLNGNTLFSPLDPTLGTHVGDRDYNDLRYLAVAANAASAAKWATARTFDIIGDVTGTGISFDGTADVTFTAVVGNDSHTHGDSTINGLDSSATTTGTFAFARIPTGTSSSTAAIGNHNHTLDGLSNTTITAIASNELLKWSGTAWINNTLAEAGISATGHTHAHSAITGIGASDHHARYADSEAVAAVGTPWTSYLPLAGGTMTGEIRVDNIRVTGATQFAIKNSASTTIIGFSSSSDWSLSNSSGVAGLSYSNSSGNITFNVSEVLMGNGLNMLDNVISDVGSIKADGTLPIYVDAALVAEFDNSATGGQIHLYGAGVDEGGEIKLGGGTSYTIPFYIDRYRNRVRFVYNGGVEMAVNDNYVAFGGDFSYGLGAVTGGYGTVQTVGTGKGSYEGYSINGHFVFMSNSTTVWGIYNDTTNQWVILDDGANTYLRHSNGENFLRASVNSYTYLYHNNISKLRVQSDGIYVTGRVTLSGIDVWSMDGADDFAVLEAGAPRLRIRDDYNGGYHEIIGTSGISIATFSTDDLQVRGAIRAGSGVEGTLTNGYIYFIPPTTASAANLYAAVASGTTYYILRSTSSARYKQDIAPFKGKVDGNRLSVLDLTPSLYRGSEGTPLYEAIPEEELERDSSGVAQESKRHKVDDDGKPIYQQEFNEAMSVGLIAEDVAENFPPAKMLDEDGNPDGIDWNNIIAGMLYELQELRAEVDKLQEA